MTDSKIDQPTPGPRRPRVGRGLAIGAAAAALVVIVGVVAFVFVADDGTDVAGSGEVESGPITSFDDIAGTIYERQGSGPQWYFLYFDDGTFHASQSQSLVEESPQVVGENRFEGTKIFYHALEGGCDDDPDAIYEIHLLENGNLQYVVLEDPCAIRFNTLDEAGFAPVP